ncbi:S-protein homolog 21 [Linum perenne]
MDRMTSCFIAFALIVVSLSYSAESGIWPDHHVHVINELNDPKEALLVHCQSKDNDLGVHYVTVKSEFTWRFKPDLVGNTLFWCYLGAPNNRHASFDVYDKALLGSEVSNNLYWKAKEDGIYLSETDNNLHFRDILKYRWS